MPSRAHSAPMAKRTRRPKLASELTPEEREELVRRFLSDPEAQKRAARLDALGMLYAIKYRTRG